jgi:uncharacterized membrane protein YccF (DUF307 family)
VLPYHRYGNLFAHTVTVEDVVGSAVTVNIRLTIVSQLPVGPAIVSVYVPAAVSVLPYHRYGSLFAQTATVEDVEGSGVTVNIKLTIVSQLPIGPEIVSVYVPAAVSVLPYHRYGSLFAHTATVEDVVGSGVTVNIRLTIVSQLPVGPAIVSL